VAALRLPTRESFTGDYSELLLQSQVVFDVPILGDASIGDAVNVSGDEIDRLALALNLPEASGEVAAETQVRDDTITGHDHLLNLAADVRDREACQLGGCQGSGNSLWRPLGSVLSTKFGASAARARASSRYSRTYRSGARQEFGRRPVVSANYDRR